MRFLSSAKGVADTSWRIAHHMRVYFIEKIKKETDNSLLFAIHLRSDGTVYFVGFETFCANVGSSHCSVVIYYSYCLDVSVPFSLCVSVGMGNSISGHLSLTADLALS